jgi:ribosomal protein S6--L-glutamate ligase
VLIQEFVEESRGTDVRAFVVGDQVIGAMRRTASGSDFRSNLHQGGQSEAIDLPRDYQETALRSAQILGLRIAGVDMLESDRGPLVLEVNSSPGLQGIERATGRNIAADIISYVDDQVAFPELDVRQRL